MVAMAESPNLRDEGHIGLEGADPLGDELRGVLEVLEGHHLNRGVHVAVRDADQAGSHARSVDLDRVGIRAGGASGSRALVGTSKCLRSLVRILRVRFNSVRDVLHVTA